MTSRPLKPVRGARTPRRRRPLLRRPFVPGSTPGQLRVEPGGLPSRVRVVRYNADVFEELEPDPAALESTVAALMQAPGIRLWVRVEGLHDAEALQQLARVAGIHPLAMEDVVHVDQRPKVDSYDDTGLFVVARVPVPTTGDADGTEQLSMFLRKGLLVTFEERRTPLLDPLSVRMQRASGRIRVRDSSYLLYAVLDVAVDAFFPVLERHSDRLADYEEHLARVSDMAVLSALHGERRSIGFLRRDLRPLKDLLVRLQHPDTVRIAEDVVPFLRDCHDHAIRLLDLVDQLREEATGVVDLHVTLAGHRMNEVMKVLTVISTIFIPLSFMAGLYGMNFDREASAWNLPELGWRYGYPILLGVMLLTAAGLLWWFRRRGFLGAGRD